MNAGTMQTVRHWLLTLVVASLVAAGISTAMLAAESHDNDSGSGYIYVEHESGGGNGGGG